MTAPSVVGVERMRLTLIRALRADSRALVRELLDLRGTWEEAGLGPVAVHALVELDLHGRLSPGELAELLNLDRSGAGRYLKQLEQAGMVDVAEDPQDRRQRFAVLTDQGRKVVERLNHAADAKVLGALEGLSPDDRQVVRRGLALYARALRRQRLTADLVLRRVSEADDAQVCSLIRAVMPEFGADGSGFAIHDPEVRAMTAAYARPGAAFWVITRGDDVILGCGGYAPLDGGAADTCEIRKMYFLPEIRGMGMGARLLEHILEGAAEDGYRRAYLETLYRMAQARRLYESFGFVQLDEPLGDTGHFGCDAWYARDLDAFVEATPIVEARTLPRA